MKPRKRPVGGKTRPGAEHGERKESHGRYSEISEASSPGRQVPEKSDAKSYKAALRSYRFQRARTPGIIEVLNENSYVMAEYSERTGSVKWQRMVLASQREQIEKWLDDHYPRRSSKGPTFNV